MQTSRCRSDLQTGDERFDRARALDVANRLDDSLYTLGAKARRHQLLRLVLHIVTVHRRVGKSFDVMQELLDFAPVIQRQNHSRRFDARCRLLRRIVNDGDVRHEGFDCRIVQEALAGLRRNEIEPDEPDEDADRKLNNPVHQAPRVDAYIRAVQAFELQADLVRHIAWVTNTRQPAVKVKSIKPGFGFILADGKPLPIYKAAGIALKVEPVSGNKAAMLEAVTKAFPNDKMAALFVQRHTVVL